MLTCMGKCIKSVNGVVTLNENLAYVALKLPMADVLITNS